MCQEGRKTRIFVHTICFGQIFFGPKQCKAGNTIKIGVSAEIAKKKNKNDTFFGEKVFLDMVEKWVLLTVFLKSCVFLKTLFHSVFKKKHSFSKTKTVCRKKTENLWKIVGCFWTWQNGVFWVCLFEVLILKRFVFGEEVLKMLAFFPNFLCFSGVAYCCSSGFGRFRRFGVSCVCFAFLCCFCFCFVCFVIGFVVGCCCFIFLCFFLFFVFCWRV